MHGSSCLQATLGRGAHWTQSSSSSQPGSIEDALSSSSPPPPPADGGTPGPPFNRSRDAFASLQRCTGPLSAESPSMRSDVYRLPHIALPTAEDADTAAAAGGGGGSAPPVDVDLLEDSKPYRRQAFLLSHVRAYLGENEIKETANIDEELTLTNS
eukprot:GHVU01029245.1.p3 GENE.GHVU01029245.1~~GHVU01029245.1.p3  ORF type:complete len:156 (+),score=29.84 GHVU01029245.1:627-1094(+)